MPQIGYCAVMNPDKLFYQGYFIIDTPEFRSMAAATLRSLQNTIDRERAVSAAIESAMLDCAMRGDHNRVAVFGLALYLFSGERFFLVVGRMTADGYYTDFIALPKARTSEEARMAIEGSQTVRAIKAAIISGLAEPFAISSQG